jgi:periplasmic protein CpxP/Spy
MVRLTYVLSAAIAALLMLPLAAFAQSNPSATPTPPSAAEAVSPPSSHAAPGNGVEQRVEEHIRQLHAQLLITANEQPQWERFANVMRQNARAMDREFTQRMQQFPTMNALQNMQSYQKIAESHVEQLQRLVPAFTKLYDAMPEQQQHLTDKVFRENAEAHAQKRLQTGSTAR